ncbi:MAG: type III-B CRISPR module RAMP protein Cmr4 [Deltaproteobacteria bacterium]|jgi:CRISPR-associated protein Cmr4|nr:type III-B CRISPR module RAMP protein Cmr4 [Deltaproteobacteria bacterium]
MFRTEMTKICVLYAVTPLHAGSGQALGAVDLPIQRERHTGWLHVQASGVKGAFRDWFHRFNLVNGAKVPGATTQARRLTEQIFGKEEGAEQGGQAGAVSVTDARILAFPVRSNTAPFVWVTCPAVLNRLKRDMSLCDTNDELPMLSPANMDDCIPITGSFPQKVVLEDLAVSTAGNISTLKTDIEKLKGIFQKLSPQVTRLLLITDQNFSFLTETATEIQPQIRIDFETGTADDGSLRYQELLPADSVLYTLVFFGQERTAEESGLICEVIRDHVMNAISSHIQMGGDMTLGRGIMEVNWQPGK